MNLSRRALLAYLGTSAITATSFAGVKAYANDVGGYRALVCVFLIGGLDCHDILIPFDNVGYDEYRNLREPLLGAQNRDRASLLELIPMSQSRFGDRQFALPPELPNLKSLFETGDAAIVANVGPLIQPTSRDQFAAGTVPLPPRLFSHNDQQSIWQANAPEGAQFGWGGLFADAALLSGANFNGRSFTSVSTSGDSLFLTGNEVSAYDLSPDGAGTIGLLETFDRRRQEAPELDAFYNTLRTHLAGGGASNEHLIVSDVAAILNGSLSANEAYADVLSSAMPLSTSFPPGQLGVQLKAVAETIAVRHQLSVGRQVFFVGIGGFDTHSEQAQDLPRLLLQLDESITAFYSAMRDLGVERDVTIFTASDFGRTFAINGDGTDHGWGGHHFVVGGSVKGGDIYGEIPPPGFGHAQDAGSGRLIPTLSVDQYAAALGRWFGLNDAALSTALPNLQNFQDRLEFMR